MGLNTKKKSRGLGNLQITQQIDTEDKVIMHFLAGAIRYSFFRKLQRETKISPLPLKKAIERLVKKGKLLELDGRVRYSSKTRRFIVPVTFLYLSNPENREYVNQVKKERKDEIRDKQISRKKRLKRIEQSKKNRLIKNLKPSFVRDEIAKALVKIVYFEEDEKQTLGETGITKKSFESWIKRSPRLRTIIKLLKKYKRKNKDLPFKNRQGQFEIPYSAIWIKRELMYPVLTKQKRNQWIRK